MELKKNQLQVIKDLDRFLELLIEKQNISKAYNALWNEKGINVGIDGMPPYNPELAGVPQVCFKVPTGGGKTFWQQIHSNRYLLLCHTYILRQWYGLYLQMLSCHRHIRH